MSVSKPRILVVDDNAMFRRLVRDLLEEEGYGVVEVGDGVQAIQLWNAEPPDLILLDLFMAGMSGVELLEYFRARDPDIPIIIVTGNDENVIHRGVLDRGATAVLTKPFTSEGFQRVIKSHIRHVENG